MASGSQGVNVQEMINGLITENKVMIFSKSYCPYCLDAKDLLSELSIDYKAIELDQDPLGYAIQQTLSEMTGQWTVPNIYINAASIGGCDDLNALHIKGKLEKMVAAIAE
ncbi:glutaredoxin [Mucor ambiguus]|uniref:Glutaredoxin n=1 Tax=Mucor ambiguus TaxID=91626 RepID=A0A0C9N4U5_9FUNG|nr:glutaredoxin [Mucor ambiguus]